MKRKELEEYGSPISIVPDLSFLFYVLKKENSMVAAMPFSFI